MKKLDLADFNLPEKTQIKKVGFVAIIGRPNAGKSTFVNALLGEKVSITSNIPQTTRKKVLGIYNDEGAQIIFFDTPGIHESEKDFNKAINAEALGTLKDAELVLYFIDTSRPSGKEEDFIQEALSSISTPVITVGTKIDLQKKNDRAMDYEISSTTGHGFAELLENIKNKLPEGPLLYPDDYYTKQTIKFRISEIIREKLFLHTKQELPHASYVGVEEIDDQSQLLKIVAYIYVETDSQKYIVIGKGGSLIQQIGKEARLELEQIFEKKVFLALRVKVMKHWRKNEKLIKKMFQ